MIITITEKSGLFTKSQTNELNNAFANINKKIQGYKTTELEYKEPIRKLTSTSFIAGQILHIRESFEVKQGYNRFVNIIELPVSIPYDVWLPCWQPDNSCLTIHILGKDVAVFGYSTVGNKANIIADIVIPYSV